MLCVNPYVNLMSVPLRDIRHFAEELHQCARDFISELAADQDLPVLSADDPGNQPLMRYIPMRGGPVKRGCWGQEQGVDSIGFPCRIMGTIA